jgi:hypothetical protein
MAAPCSGGLETTSGASFVDACAEAVLSPEVLPNLSDCNQQKHVGLVVEFFSGTCRLSKACRKYGLRALPVDKDPKRAEHCAVATYDLTDPEQHTTLVAVLQAKKYMLVHAHCAPICGTDSLAFHYTNNRSLSVVTTTQTVSQISVTLSAIDLTVQTGRTRPQPACS